MFKRYWLNKFLFCFSIFIIFTGYSNYIFANSLDINARSYVVIDRKSKKILIGNNEYNKVKMASTTKIMTATIIIENCSLKDTVTISKKAASTSGSRVGLKENDKVSVFDLLYGLLLCSGNDAAVALAEHLSGSVQSFANLMNEKANTLGLSNTHFETPHGLDSDNHFTTAYELALLTDYALNNETFKNIVGTKTYTITINGYPKKISNTNELLGNLDGIYGVKTGFTNGANRCLVTSCIRDDMDIICVVLGCDTKKFRGLDSTKLINYCFENFEYVDISQFLNTNLNEWKKENLNYFKFVKSSDTNIDLTYSIEGSPIIPINKNDIDYLTVNFSINNTILAPVLPNSILGNYEILANDKSILIGSIKNTNIIKKKNINFYMHYFIKDFSDFFKDFCFI